MTEAMFVITFVYNQQAGDNRKILQKEQWEYSILLFAIEEQRQPL
jgi:hypothetical protein